MAVTHNEFNKRSPAEKELLRQYQSAAKKLVAIVASMPVSAKKIEKERRLAEVTKIIDDLLAEGDKWIEKNIPKMYQKGVNAVSAQYGDLKEKDFKVFPFAGVNKAAVSILSDELSTSFGNTLVGVKNSVEKAFTKIQKRSVNDAIIRNTIAGVSSNETKGEIIQELKSKGIEVFKAYGPKKTRIFRLGDYADLLVRTQTMKAYNSGAMARSLSAGRRFMKVSIVRPDIDGNDICNEHEGKIVDLLDTSQVLPPFHPRCRHILIAVSFSEIERKNPEFYEKAKAYFDKKKQELS